MSCCTWTGMTARRRRPWLPRTSSAGANMGLFSKQDCRQHVLENACPRDARIPQFSTAGVIQPRSFLARRQRRVGSGLPSIALAILASATQLSCLGCQAPASQQLRRKPARAEQEIIAATPPAAQPGKPVGRLASHHEFAGIGTIAQSANRPAPEAIPSPASQTVPTLADLEALALVTNPSLRRMQQEAAAKWARTGYVSKLPDPTVSSMFFIPPMQLEPDRWLAEVQVMQTLPWLGRLNAEARRAQLEALAAANQYQAERLRVVGDLRAAWFRLYVLGKQVAVTEADKAQLQSLIRTANSRVATGAGQPGEVLIATVELSSLQEQLLSYRAQIAASTAEIQRLVGRDAFLPINPPVGLDVGLPEWNYELLVAVAMESQPELAAARLRTAATRWGVDIARLRRRPDVTVIGGWMPMDAPNAAMPGAGKDSWTLGMSTNVPIYHDKYNAMVSEASREHFAAHASEDEVAIRLNSELHALWEQAKSNWQTVELYEKSILPQARQAFEADQKSLINNTVTFERVIRDYRTLLNLELGYHRALGELATTLARIRQVVGNDLTESVSPRRNSI